MGLLVMSRCLRCCSESSGGRCVILLLWSSSSVMFLNLLRTLMMGIISLMFLDECDVVLEL